MKRRVYEVLHEMHQLGIFKDYALGGSMAYTYFVNPIPTNDVDFFVIIDNPSLIVEMSPIFDYMAKNGLTWDGDHIVIDGVKVNIFPSDDSLYLEAIHNAEKKDTLGVSTKIITPEYLICTSLQAARTKDWLKIEAMVDNYPQLDKELLQQLIGKFHLERKWSKFLSLKQNEIDPKFLKLDQSKKSLRLREAAMSFEAKSEQLLFVLDNVAKQKGVM